MRLHATIRPHPDNGERRDIQSEAATYEVAYEQLAAQIPDGWLALAVLRDDG